MTEWKEYKFSDFVDINPLVRIPKNIPISFVEMKDLDPSMRYCESSQLKLLSGGSRFINGDTLFARITPCLENGKICQVRYLQNNIGFGSTEFHVFRAKNGISDTNFVYYLSRWNEVREHAELNLEGSSGRQRVSKEAFDNLYLLLPPLPEQKRIASILSSLDDKIDLLHRENKTLETMAETLFRQWFIEEAKEDWEEKPLSFYGKIVCGKTPPKKESKYFGGETPFIKIPDMHNKTFVINSEDSLTKEGVLYQKEKILPPFSIIVSCIATVGLVVLNAKEAQTNQQINSIIPYAEEYRYFLYLHLMNMYDDLNAMASGGTATLNLNTSNFSKIKIAYPTDDVLCAFNKQVSLLFDKIYNNQQQIQTLIQQRDALLPKLMNNEINI
jgi:type I restriction enzyme S subunit